MREVLSPAAERSLDHHWRRKQIQAIGTGASVSAFCHDILEEITRSASGIRGHGGVHELTEKEKDPYALKVLFISPYPPHPHSGSQIAFTRPDGKDVGTHVYLIRKDRTGLTQVTFADGVTDRGLSWGR